MTFKFGKHDCNKDYCNLCKEMVSFDHECFIKVVPKELEVELDEEEQPIHIQADVGHFVPLPLRTLDTSYLRDTSYRNQIGHFVPSAESLRNPHPRHFVPSFHKYEL